MNGTARRVENDGRYLKMRPHPATLPRLKPGWEWNTTNGRIIAVRTVTLPAEEITAKIAWFERIRIGLSITHAELADICGASLAEIEELCKWPRHYVGDVAPMLEKLMDHVNYRLGHYMAIRSLLHRKLNDDRRERLLRRERIRT